MKDCILEIIKSSNGKISFDGLIKKLNIKKELLEELLLELKLDGKILETSNKYSLFPDGMLIGDISVTKNRNKVIFYDGRIIPLASNFFDYVILNDKISFVINDKGEAEITSIIDREIREVTCRIITNGKKKKVECFYKGLDINLPKDIMDTLSDGDVISVSIGINDIDSGYCECKFKKVIGHASDPNIDEIMIAASYGFDNEYSDEYLEEIARIPTYVKESDCINRTDFRNLDFVTIDCVSAKDMDDAVYAYRLNGGYRVYVSIADVSHFVKLSSLIFNRAFEKGNSCYINNSVFHMLHQVLSNGICSLNPDEDRLTKTVVMDIDNEGNIIDFNVCKSVIKSRKKMDYVNVDKILVDGIIPSGYEEYVDLVKVLHEVSSLLEHMAIHVKGKVDFPSDEVCKEYDEFGNVISVKDAESTPATKLIEYLMIAANTCVASYILWSCMPSMYRVHNKPNIKKVNATLRDINMDKDIGVKFKLIDSAEHPKVIQGILNKLSNLDEYPILAGILLQSMERAVYSTENIGHYALGEEVYTHFTSPIRRLCDLIVHMILDILLDDFEMVNEVDFDKLEQLLQEACKQATKMEGQAEVAEYDGNRLAIIKSMQEYIGYEYDAVVLEVGERIRIKVNGIDCFVKYKNLSDEFRYDEDRCRYYDKNNGMILKLGAKIKVILNSVNLNNRTINVDIVGIIQSKKLVKNK